VAVATTDSLNAAIPKRRSKLLLLTRGPILDLLPT
jgi:hypothetical protein